MTVIDAVAAALGAAPGLIVGGRAGLRYAALMRHTATRHPCPTSERSAGQRFDLWRRPHCFVRPGRKPGSDTTRRLRALKRRLVFIALGGVALAFAGGVAALAVMRSIA